MDQVGKIHGYICSCMFITHGFSVLQNLVLVCNIHICLSTLYIHYFSQNTLYAFDSKHSRSLFIYSECEFSDATSECNEIRVVRSEFEWLKLKIKILQSLLKVEHIVYNINLKWSILFIILNSPVKLENPQMFIIFA